MSELTRVHLSLNQGAAPQRSKCWSAVLLPDFPRDPERQSPHSRKYEVIETWWQHLEQGQHFH